MRVHRRPLDPRAHRGGARQRARPVVEPARGADREEHRRQGGYRRRRPARDRNRLRRNRARGAQLRPHPRPRARARARLSAPSWRSDLDRHGVRRRGGTPQRPHRRRPAVEASHRPRRPRAADHRRHRVRRASRCHASGQEDPGRSASTGRARRPGPSGHPLRTRRAAAARRPPGTSGMTAPTAEQLADRRRRAAEALAGPGAEGLLVTTLVNVRYLTGFTGSNGALVLAADGTGTFLTDGRYRDQAGYEVPTLEHVITRDLLGEAGKRMPGTWACETHTLSVD